jgi:hypothetical protein
VPPFLILAVAGMGGQTERNEIMVMTKGGNVSGDNRPNAGDYNAPSPRVAKLRQKPYKAPTDTQTGAGPRHSAFEAMEKPVTQPGSRRK